MISFDEFVELADRIACEIPEEYYDKLNGGVCVLQERRLAKYAQGRPCYALGSYQTSRETGRAIYIYYGSFLVAFPALTEAELTEKLREVIRHEFRHHIESLAGCDDLVKEDDSQYMSWIDANYSESPK